MCKKLFWYLATVLLSAFCLLSCEQADIDDEPVLEVSQQEINADSKGGNYTVTVTANRNLTVSIADSWCTYRLLHRAENGTKGTLTLTVNPNGTPDDRQTTATISAEGHEDVVVVVKQPSSAKGMLSFSLLASRNPLANDVVFEYNPVDNSFSAMYLKWIDADEPHMLVPDFTARGTVLVDGKEVVSGETAISFADDFVVSVRNSAGDVEEHKVVFNCPQINTELPVLHMKPDKLISSKDNYVDTYIELYDKTPQSTGKGWWDSAEKGKIEMRGRGNSTWGLPKKPFRMKFTEKFSPIGLDHAKEKSWTLLAQDMDKSLLRTHLAFEYSRALFDPADNYHHEKAILFTPASKYINVYLTGDYYDSSTGKTRYMDGEYLGLYQMSDQLQRADGRVSVEKLKESDGNDPEKITGGYLIEADIHEGNHPSPVKRIRFTYKYPEDDDFHQSQYDYITNFIGQAEQALYGSNFKDPVNGWRKYFDEKTLADFIIIKEFVGDMDGFTSIYAYKRRGYDKLFFGPVWDCDKGWGNDKRVPHSQYPPLSSLMLNAGFWMPGAGQDDWFQHFWSDETFRAFVANRWAEKKAELIAITDMVLEEVPANMAKAIEANFTVWPFNYQHCVDAPMPAENYQAEIKRIKELSVKREELLDRLFNR